MNTERTHLSYNTEAILNKEGLILCRNNDVVSSYTIEEAKKLQRFLNDKLKSELENNESGFTTYDSSQGHCGLCGRLGCNGKCFK